MSRDPGDAGDEALRASAADWFARMHGSDAAGSAQDFQAWLDENPAHGDAYQRMVMRWDQAKFGGQTRAARARDLSSVAAWHTRPAARRAAGLALVVLGAGGLAYHALAPTGARPQPQRVATALGETRMVGLDDGSRVTLDSASLLRASFDPSARLAHMDDGTIRFDVVPEARPFTILTRHGSVSARDALFDVTVTRGLLRVTALRGDVTVAAGAAGARPAAPGAANVRRVGAGQRVTATAAGIAMPTTATPDDLGWPSGLLSFEDERLGDAVEEINRHGRRRVLLADPSIAALRISGVFHAHDPDRFAHAVAALTGLAVRDGAAGSIVLGHFK